jgi:hypothetical protein
MPIPQPDVEPDKYDYMDCRPGPSKYPAGSRARMDQAFYELLMANPKTRHLAEKLRPPRV